MRLTALVVGLLALVAVARPAQAQQQMTDPDFRPEVARPAWTADAPVVVIDGAHNNFHTVDGRYAPFAALLRADGLEVRGGTAAFDAGGLDGVDVLVIANAGLVNGRSPFTADEITAVEAWVRDGGKLLLIADHAPFGTAAEALASRIGVRMGTGYAFTTDGRDLLTNLTYGREALGDHPILAGRSPDERVGQVVAFTGQSLDGPEGAAVLLPLPAGAREAPDLQTLQRLGDRLERSPASEAALGELSRPALPAQGLAFSHGEGRVVVLGEAGMLSAQVLRFNDGQPDLRFGMNTAPGNPQFGLNIMRWLAGRLP